ncbi:peptidoglycan-binding protein [Virgibacillus oceani]
MKRKLRVGIFLIVFSLFCLNPLAITAAENEEPEQESSEKEEVEEGTEQTEDESNEAESKGTATQEETISESNKDENNATEDINKDEENNDTNNEETGGLNNSEDEDKEEPQDSKKRTSIMADDSPPYEEGTSGSHVVKLKKNLTKLGIGSYPENPSNYFGDSTRYNVEEFQRYYGLEVIGIADEETLSVLADNVNSSYQDGERGDHIVELKKNLTALGIGNYPSSPSNYFGDSTENNVKEFQRLHELKENGIADQVTLAKIDEKLKLLHEPPYEEGTRGDHVVELKKNLTKLGIGNYPENPSNYFGDSTKYNVEEFQRYYGLEVTGIANEETLSVLGDNVNSSYQDGERGDHIVKLKKNLTTLGIGNYPSNPSNYFGDSTEHNVKEFQRLHDLKENGIADDVTLAKIEELLELSEGTRGQHVVELKKNLTKLGIGNYPKNPSNFFGDSTRYNVEEFQRYYGLEVTGIADEGTLSVLGDNVNSPYQDGERGDHVVELKKNLTTLGIGNYPSSPSNYFGDSTEYNVSEFQRYYGLKVNGIADDVTLAKIEDLLVPHEGVRGQHVVELKKNLTKLGIGNYPENPSNFYGDSTRYNVEEFQRYYGLEITGIADEETLSVLDDNVNSPYQDGERGDHVIELKENLTRLGIGNYPENPSNYFGDSTAYNVSEFQRYYGLNENGIADDVTLEKIQEILNSSHQEGERGDHVVELKENLTRLGIGNYPESPSNYFGDSTAYNVSEFQRYYGLNENGIADDVTLEKIEEILNSPFQDGERGDHVVELKRNLSKLGIGNYPENPSNYFGDSTEHNVKEFQRLYGLKVNGIADEVTLSTIDELLRSNRYTQYNLTLSEATDIQMRLNNPAPQTDQKYAYVSGAYIDEDERVTASVLNVRSGPSTNGNIVGTLEDGSQVNIISEVGGWYQIEYETQPGTWVDAARADVLYYLDPSNFIDDERQRFQFLDLARTSDASADLLNDYLSGKGILEGRGQSFIDASNTHDVNDVYLLSHALLETGHGSSVLANGVEVGKNQSGKLVLVNASNRSSLTDIKTTYNMYGIGAVDGNAHQGGAFRAYEEGWYTPEAAIIGGAGFIGNNYVKAGQNTLYKMRWNPTSMDENGYASHQYATDVGWASKQVTNMYNLYQDLNIFNVYLEIPQYLK